MPRSGKNTCSFKENDSFYVFNFYYCGSNLIKIKNNIIVRIVRPSGWLLFYGHLQNQLVFIGDWPVASHYSEAVLPLLLGKIKNKIYFLFQHAQMLLTSINCACCTATTAWWPYLNRVISWSIIITACTSMTIKFQLKFNAWL